MGTTLHNIHVFIGAQGDTASPQRVISALEAAMQGAGYQTTTVENAERSIRVIFSQNSKWLTVDQGDSLTRLADMPKLLSQQLAAPVLEVELHDSDVLQMQLFHAGKKVDVFSDWSNYDRLPRKRKGNASRWAKALPAVPSAAALEQAWTPVVGDSPFASEAVLYRVLDLLKLDRWHVWGGHPSGETPTDAQVIDLHFRYTKPHPYNQPAVGLPVLRRSAYQEVAERNTERNFEIVFSVMNLGGESVGIGISLQGEALNTALVEPVGLITAPPYNSWNGNITVFPERRTGLNGGTSVHFQLETQVLPAGLADWDAVYALPLHLRDFNKESKLHHQAGMFAVVLKPLRKGTERFTTRIIPLANLGGAAEFSTDVTIT